MHRPQEQLDGGRCWHRHPQKASRHATHQGLPTRSDACLHACRDALLKEPTLLDISAASNVVVVGALQQ